VNVRNGIPYPLPEAETFRTVPRERERGSQISSAIRRTTIAARDARGSERECTRRVRPRERRTRTTTDIAVAP